MNTPLPHPLPSGITVLERGWLSSNNVLCVDSERTALVDTGYCTHAEQTLALVAHALGGRTLDGVLNTHLHSDHCGGNAALQARYPALCTAIPPGSAQAVGSWDEAFLGYSAFGQSMVRYSFQRILHPGTVERMAACDWQVHAAPGHDPHAVLLFEPASRTLISGDALWQTGFGVVFPELAGESGYAEVGDTLDLIERLKPATVIPGHGPVFTDVATALGVARKRLDGFVQHPARHTRHAAKVLLKYKLLELGHTTRAALHTWAGATPMLAVLHSQTTGEGPRTAAPEDAQHPVSGLGHLGNATRCDSGTSGAHFAEWLDGVLADLVRSGAAGTEGQAVFNT